MTAPENNFLNTPFSSEQACIVYLFRKRWPWGFKCPFCGSVQQDIAPAYVVVCRYCRKQISITAHTLMHGSKKSLVAWMRVSWKFCSNYEGISARELQRLMELSCYQTAWSWLQKIRRGAALAESAPCGDIVLFDLLPLPFMIASPQTCPDIGLALELSHPDTARVRLVVLHSSSPGDITAAVNQLVEKRATLLIRNRQWLSDDCLIASDLRGQPTTEQLARGHLLLDQAMSWLNAVYRRTVNPYHLQGYLDEFCFRYNTTSWPDHLTLLDHLLTGLLSSVGEPYRVKKSSTTGAMS